MKNLILSCFALCSLVTIAGCSCDEDRHTSTTESTSLTTDYKDMTPHHRHHDDDNH